MAGAWLLTGVVLYATYTANLTAFLTVTRRDVPFDTLAEMIAPEQTEYAYGASANGVVMLITKTATSGIYAELGERLVGINSSATGVTGVQMARDGRFAYISDATYLARQVTEDCQLTLIKERFYKTGFGIVVPQGWPYKKYFDAVIIKLIEGGFIQYWSRGLMPDYKCESLQANFSARSFTIRDMAGCFIILAVGIFISTVSLIVEVITHSLITRRRTPRQCGDDVNEDGPKVADGGHSWRQSWLQSWPSKI